MKNVIVTTDGNKQKFLNLGQLAEVFNDHRESLLATANCDPGNDMARTRKWEACGALRLLDDLAHELGLKSVKTYSVK